MTKPSVFFINKTKIILFPIKNVRSVKINTSIKCGSQYEKGKSWGIFHLLEHMLFTGTQKFPSAEKISEFNKENGIYSNAFTNRKRILFIQDIPDINLNKGLEIFEEVIFNSLIDETKMKNEFKVINQEFLSKWDRPENRFLYKTNKHIFGKDHIYTRDGLGQIDFIEKIPVANLKKIYLKYFQPQNLTISITGNFSTNQKLIKKMTEILTKYQNNYQPTIKYPLIKPSNKKTIIHYDNPKQDQINLIWILEKNRKNNRLEQISNSVFNNLFGRGSDSLLFKIFRQKYGLVYGIGSSVLDYENCSLFEISCQIDPNNSQKFLKLLKKELKNIFDQIDLKTFQRTINYLNFQTLMTYDSVKGISDMVTNESFEYKEIFLPEDYINLSKEINFQKTINYFKQKITWENKYLFKMTPIKPEN
jgi:predicted Zn-dependent peptidase